MATITLNDPKTVLSNQPLAASFLNNTETTVYKSDGEGNDTKVEYTVADVYDDAAVIGSELEKIITNYGVDVLKDLMPKVISVLELLENLTIKSERENEEKSELKMKIHSLEYEKSQRNNERERFEKELEEIEEKWQKESFKLIDMVNKLKDENKRLNDSLTQNSTFLKSTEHLVIKQEELDYIRQIKEENIKLKEINRFKEKEIEQKMTESEALTSQIETLSNTMLNFRRKQIVSQNQIEKMVKAKAELECTVTERDQQLSIIREKLHMHNIHKEDKSNYIEHDDDELEETKEKIEYKKLNPQFNENESFDNEVTEMIMINSKDPNRPRFTLKELQKVLMEKNQLTVKLDQTKDELEQLKKGDVMNQNDGEVQGPINKEPDDKIEGSKSTTTSGIRRLYVLDSNNLIAVVVDLQFIDVENLIFECFCLSSANNHYNYNFHPYSSSDLRNKPTFYGDTFKDELLALESPSYLINQYKPSFTGEQQSNNFKMPQKFRKNTNNRVVNNKSLENCLAINTFQDLFTTFTSKSSEAWPFDLFSLIIFLLNVFYLLICVHLHKFFLNFLITILGCLFSCDLMLAVALFFRHKCNCKLKAATVISVATILVYTKLQRNFVYFIK